MQTLYGVSLQWCRHTFPLLWQLPGRAGKVVGILFTRDLKHFELVRLHVMGEFPPREVILEGIQYLKCLSEASFFKTMSVE